MQLHCIGSAKVHLHWPEVCGNTLRRFRKIYIVYLEAVRIFLTSDFASFLPALRCFFRQDRLGIDSKSASIGQKILQNQSATKIPNRTLYKDRLTQLKSDRFNSMQQTRGFQRLNKRTPFEYRCINLN
jgi:hypothetical protein